jgi:uncharacterized Tic20 family protein
MPASADPRFPADPGSDSPPLPVEEQPPGQALAILAVSLYLANLLLLPGLAFAALAWLYLRRHAKAPRLAQAHLGQALSASLWAGVLLVLVNLIIVLLGGYQGVHTWVIVILYFTFIHSTLVILGMVGLAKAMAGQAWRMPLFGRFPFITGASPGTA